MKVVAIVQARTASTRLPGKVMRKINGIPLIEILLNRLSHAKKIDKVILATTDLASDDDLAHLVQSLGFDVFRGHPYDVLDRYLRTAEKYNADVIVRITGDCPLIDPQIVDFSIDELTRTSSDYVSNTINCDFPDGLDTETFRFSVLRDAWLKATKEFDREHVTPFIKNSSEYRTSSFSSPTQLGHMRWCVDDQDDFVFVSKIFNHFFPDIFFSWKDAIEISSAIDKIEPMQRSSRNAGAFMSKGQKLWSRAKSIIPGGNMLLSKRAELFLPNFWPAYFSEAKGCEVWDLDNKKYIDMSLMGVGTNSLGYGHPFVDNAVRACIDKGNMSTLNCPEEVLLAEKLVEMHPWADMVKFARSGGEANSIAVRIARAASGRDGIAVCGYHGWHDWYLSANIKDSDNLSSHLLPGLNPIGVPKSLSGSVHLFEYNDFSSLKRIVENYSIGVIKMEVMRNEEPRNDFLLKVRELANQNNIVLVFDECTSGFRETFGGIHKKFGIDPDIAVFGKTLGNGYAITAVIGERSVMEYAQDTFISSTFWTERIGPTAGIAALDAMYQIKSWEIITDIGTSIRNGWQSLADDYKLKISHLGIPALAGFSFLSENNLKYKTLITQEMLKKGFLASNSVYSCVCHCPDMIQRYFEALSPIFALVRDCEGGRDIDSLLEGDVCQTGFKRLN